MPTKAMVYRDFCNACGASRDALHEERCHLTGVVGAWSGIRRPEAIASAKQHGEDA